ncbi:MAG TPA: hypothetical protein VFE78_32685 [Gemmataceae bacterium]|jgi:hypothetical protein|nr:hypothetical protein [Gemmataceae bacterium]
MSRSAFHLWRFGLAALLLAILSSSAVSGDDKRPAADKGKAAGILIQRDKRTLLIRPDGEDQPVKYLLPDSPDAKLAAALKGLFTVQRVRITYQTVGDTRQITGLVRSPGKANGVITGKVIAVHDNFWVEVKPSNGPPEGFAAGAPDRSAPILATLKTLEKGDTVTIRYYTDFERHRIVSIRKAQKK